MLLPTFLDPVEERCTLCLGSGGSAIPGQGPRLPAPGEGPWLQEGAQVPGWGFRLLAQKGLPLLVATIPCSPSQEARSQIRDTPQGSPCGHTGLEFSMASPRADFSNIQYSHELDVEFNGRLATVCQFLMKIIGKTTPLKHFSL